ncbi:MAG: (Fe-S)-binding protein, partial [Dehalococcoidia bacterium]
NGRTNLLQSRFGDAFLCIGCLACNSQCPACISGKPLSPRELILNLKKHLSEVGSDFLEDEDKAETPPASSSQASGNGVITKDEIWACTTCRACQEACPVEVEHIDTIIGLRQNLVMEQAIIPNTAEVALRSIEARGHPWRGTTLTRTDWTQGLNIKTLAEDNDIDILYWVGCTEALEDRSMKVAQAMGKLLKLAGIEAGILGVEESCCGEPARRLGNEYLFQMQAEKNIELLKSYNVKKIVVACPHCYHVLKNEYTQFGGKFEVIHHTQFIADLLEKGKLGITNGNERVVTYHDPCYLGRYNGIYEPPRQILNNIPGTTVVDMEQNRQKGFCCGGGGGRMWLEERIGRRISEMRIDRAIETKSEILATACPYCLQMFDDAVKTKAVEESLKVMDIAELIAESAVSGTEK